MIKLLFIYLQCLLPLISIKYCKKTPCDKVYLSVFGFGNKPLLSKAIFLIMEFKISEKKKSGVYIISNYINKMVYIGSTSNLYKRYKYHKQDLKRNTHRNNNLQLFYNEHGSDTLFFELLEYCDCSILLEREQYYLDTYNSNLKFNVSTKSTGGCDNIKTYSFINPNGDIVNVTNIKKFCEDNNLSDSKMIALQKHKRTIHKGWKALNGASKKIHKLYIPIIKYDLNNNLLEEFSSLQKALDSLKTTNELYLKRCLDGQINSFKGFIWKYKNAKKETITS